MEKLTIKKTDWDLTPVLQNENLILKKRKEWEKASYDFINKWKKRKDYLINSKILKEALDEYEKWKRNFGTEASEGYYFYLKTFIDQNNPKLKAKYGNVEDFSKKIENDIQFFILNIGKISRKNQKIFLESPDLNEYKHFLERVFSKSKYWLSEKEEKIMNLKEKSSYSSWVDMLSGLLSKEEREVIDEDGKKSKKTYTDMVNLMMSVKKEVRDKSAEVFNEIMKKYSELAEIEINAILNDKKINDELRGYKRADSARHLSDDIDSKIIDSLIDVVTKRFDISKRFYEFKAKLFGLKRLEYHERIIPYGNINKEYNFEDSVNLVYSVFDNLDEKFSEIFKNYIDNSQIDVYPKPGKKGGAWCFHSLISQPTYIILNHANKIDNVMTLAHEAGHGINNELIKEKQNSLYFGTPKSTAEVASTFFEDFVLKELMKNSNDELKLSIIVQKLDNDVKTIFRQIAAYRFERELHLEYRKKGYLSKEEIGEIFKKHMSDYMGEFVIQSPGSENWWVYWPHIRDYFYVYSYASGLLISKAMQGYVRENPNFILKVKEFLSAGLSESPHEIFLKMGIDITDKKFWERGLLEVEDLLTQARDLAKKMGKI